mmetsp:Transcript_2356/g.4871  ORF Transcript_2356/g.4871 Transcript_2356/m.4871 type:complete len:121 (-) Transcript_2356:202-564(-)
MFLQKGTGTLSQERRETLTTQTAIFMFARAGATTRLEGHGTESDAVTTPGTALLPLWRRSKGSQRTTTGRCVGFAWAQSLLSIRKRDTTTVPVQQSAMAAPDELSSMLEKTQHTCMQLIH